MTRESLADARRRIADDAIASRVADATRSVRRIVLGAVVALAASGAAALVLGDASMLRRLGAVTLAVAVVAAIVAGRQARRLDAATKDLAASLAHVDATLAEAERTRHLASLGEVSAVLAHEIRNPIAAVKGHSQLLVELAGENEKLRAKAQRIEGEALRLEKLTDDLLTFARSGRLRTRTIDLRPLATQAATTVSSDIVLELPDSPVTCDVDAGRMLQVLENLLRNAIRHGRAPIRLSARSAGANVQIEVRDHGAGIPPARLETIFEPFVTDATRGTGLGLAVVRRVVDMHGGRVTATNHPDGGALFSISLPVAGSRGGEG